MKKEKKTIKLIFFLTVLFLLDKNIYAQNEKNVKDTTISMKEAVVVANRLQYFSSGNKIQSIDSITISNYASNTLSEIIYSNTLGHINSYGNGGLSEISIRGSGKAHTAVMWNGFNLQDILNGGVDFSLIPCFLLDDVKIQYGGSGALFGSGAIGGAIHLNNDIPFNSGINTSITGAVGSYSTFFEGISVGIGRKKYAGKIRIFNRSVKNDFEYINTILPDAPKQKLDNSEIQQEGVLLDNYFKIKDNQKISIHTWFQNNAHSIPTDMTIAESKSSEENNFIKCSAEWRRYGEKLDIFLRTAYLNSYKYYTDPLFDDNSKYQSESSINEFENNYKISKHLRINSGINYTYEKGHSDNIDGAHYRNRTSVFSSLKYNNLNYTWKAVMSLRDELIEGNYSPLTYSFGFEGKIIKGLIINGNINKSYRIPSFNDLYWKQLSLFWNSVGNPELKNEEGLNEEVGLIYNLSAKKMSYNIGVSVFNSDVTNWIIWQPVDLITWKPFNVNTVFSRGMECNTVLSYNLQKVFFKVSGTYTLMKTTNETKTADISVFHKQLIYVPKQKAVINLFVEYKGYGFTYSQNYVDKRFYDAENKNFVDAYTIENITVSKEFILKKIKVNFNIHINNIWNKTYQVMAFYPMPLRNYQAGIKLSFKKNNKK